MTQLVYLSNDYICRCTPSVLMYVGILSVKHLISLIAIIL